MHPIVRRSAFQAASGISRIVPLIRSTTFGAAADRGRALVLLYHRVSDRPSAVVPVVTPATLAAHLETLASVAEVVPITDLALPRGRGSRVRVAVTFDDDDPAHLEVAFPVLKRLNVPATFFLSGRSLHGLPHYWWTALEEAISRSGVEAVARTLGVRGDVANIAKACEDPCVAERLSAWPIPSTDRMLSAADIRELADGGMTIGFHTLRHPVLPLLDERALDVALTEGRRELAAAAGVSIETISYPHGRSDARVARAAERHGFVGGFATGGRGVPADGDRFLVPRWEPGPLRARDLLGEAMVRVHV